MKKTLFCFLLLAALVVPAALFAGGSSEAATTGGSAKATLNVWTLWTESSQDVNAQVFRKVLAQAQQAMPDLVIQHDATENEAYKTKIKTAIAANEAPDVFFSWGAGFVKPGRHIHFPASQNRQVQEVFLSLLQHAGIAAQEFGDFARRPIPDLT